MKTFRYVPHHQVDAYLRRGWRRTGGLEWSHHGFYAELMVAGGWWAVAREHVQNALLLFESYAKRLRAVLGRAG